MVEKSRPPPRRQVYRKTFIREVARLFSPCTQNYSTEKILYMRLDVQNCLTFLYVKCKILAMHLPDLMLTQFARRAGGRRESPAARHGQPD